MDRMHTLTFWNFIILKIKEKEGTDFALSLVREEKEKW